MNSDQINKDPFRIRSLFLNRIWWLALLGMVGIFVYIRYDEQVFPSASISLSFPARRLFISPWQLANQLGYEKLSAIESTQFTLDQDAKTFLEYELGISQANQLMKEDLPIWSWRTRFCRQHEQEEFRIWLSPAGRLYSFIHEFKMIGNYPPSGQRRSS